MKLNKLFEFFIQQGIRKDPRGAEEVKKLMDEKKAGYEKLSKEDKEFFDTDTLTNPFPDSRILNGSGSEEIGSIILGVDMETPELLLAHTLRQSGKKIDLVMTHHPEGKAYATFYNVMGVQTDILHKEGVPINIAESLTNSRMEEVSRRVLPQNHTRATDAAKALNIPFMSAHTVADNQVADYLEQLFDSKKPRYVKDILKMLKEIPEYQESAKIGAGPLLLLGKDSNRAGKVFVDMTGGTEGAKEAIEKLADAGVGTMVCMHMSDDHYKEAKKNHINVVIAGHISSDNLGLNLLLDSAEKEFGKLDVIEVSGFRRFRRA